RGSSSNTLALVTPQSPCRMGADSPPHHPTQVGWVCWRRREDDPSRSGTILFLDESNAYRLRPRCNECGKLGRDAGHSARCCCDKRVTAAKLCSCLSCREGAGDRTVSEALEAVTANANRAWHDDTGMHVRLRIVNHSDRTLFVGRGKRRLQFDADASLLTVWLCDHELEESIGQRCAIGLTMPSAVALGAGTEVE